MELDSIGAFVVLGALITGAGLLFGVGFWFARIVLGA